MLPAGQLRTLRASGVYIAVVQWSATKMTSSQKEVQGQQYSRLIRPGARPESLASDMCDPQKVAEIKVEELVTIQLASDEVASVRVANDCGGHAIDAAMRGDDRLRM